MNTATLTAKIAALPEPMRALIAGAVAWKLSPDDKLIESGYVDKALVDEWRPLWDMSRSHPGKDGFDWVEPVAVYRTLRRVGVERDRARQMIKGYVYHDDTVLSSSRYDIDNSRHPARRK